MEIKRKIQTIKKRFGYTDSDIASKLGVSAQTIWRWENGKVKPHRRFEKDLDSLLIETINH